MADLAGQNLKADWSWLAFAASLPSRPFPFPAFSVGAQILTGRYVLKGVSFANTATVAGTLTLYDGRDNNGPLLCAFDYAASSSQTQPLTDSGILIESGVYAQITAGALTAALWAVPLWHYNVTPPGE